MLRDRKWPAYLGARRRMILRYLSAINTQYDTRYEIRGGGFSVGAVGRCDAVGRKIIRI